MFFDMKLWIKLPPEKDFLLEIKLKQGITLCYFNLLESYFRSFELKLNISTLKMKLNRSLNNTRNGSSSKLNWVGCLFLHEK